MNGPTIPISLLIITIGLVAIARSQIGAAIAHAIRVNASDEDEQLSAEVAELRRDLDQVRQELLETQERLDFAERLIASGRDQAARIHS